MELTFRKWGKSRSREECHTNSLPVCLSWVWIEPNTRGLDASFLASFPGQGPQHLHTASDQCLLVIRAWALGRCHRDSSSGQLPALWGWDSLNLGLLCCAPDGSVFKEDKVTDVPGSCTRPWLWFNLSDRVSHLCGSGRRIYLQIAGINVRPTLAEILTQFLVSSKC